MSVSVFVYQVSIMCDWVSSLGIANSGAPRMAERYVGRSPGTSGLPLPGYSSRYFGLMVSMCIATMLLLEPSSSYWWRNQSLNTETRSINSACCFEVTWLPRRLYDVRKRSSVLEIDVFSLPVPSYDLCDKRSMTIDGRVLPSKILEILVCGVEPAMASQL